MVNVLAVAPGKDTKTLTIGGAIVGNCDVGKVSIAKMPMKIVTIESAIASTGLLKNALNIVFYFMILKNIFFEIRKQEPSSA